MRIFRCPRIDATILGAAALLALGTGTRATAEATEHFRMPPPAAVAVSQDGAAGYVGVWMSADDTLRLDIAADGTYERSVLGRKKSALGYYHVDGTSLQLRDDSGVRTTVTSANGKLKMAGYELART
jgi:hypothetical protein